MKYVLAAIFMLACILIYRQTMGKYKLLSPDEFSSLIASDSTVQLVDVRTADEYASGHIPHSRNIDYNRTGFKAEVERMLNPKQKVALYCRSGMRSAAAAKVLSGMGYDVVDLDGGFLAWSANQEKNN